MKLGRVRLGERFVFDHVGGVYQKVSTEKARCIYGKHFGKEEPITPDVSVYVIFEDRNKMKKIGDVSNDPSDCSAGVVNTAALAVCTRCGGQLVGKPAGCPKCNVMVYDAPTSSPDAGVVPVPAPEQVPAPASAPATQENVMHIIVIDENENCLLKIPNASMQQVVAFAKAEGVRLEKSGKGRIIRETFYDYVDSVYYVVLGGKYD